MKYIVLIAAIATILPLGLYLRSRPELMPRLWFAIGAAPFLGTLSPLLEMSVISWPTWPGHTKGIEISIVEILAAVALLTLPKASGKYPFRYGFIFYFAAIVFSTATSSVPIASLFYAWQLVRVYFVSMVIWRASIDKSSPLSILHGLGFGLCIETCFVIWQRFGLGMVQTPGTFGHQNLLGFISHFVTIPFLAIILSRKSSLFEKLVLLCGSIVVVMTTSRATVAFACGGALLIFFISSFRHMTAHKAKVGFVAIFGLAALIPLSLASFEYRFQGAPWLEETYDERAAFIRAASSMLTDHPLGVGANTFVIVANTQGYYDEAEVAATPGSRSAHVHNVYWLAAAETGYFGLAGLLSLLFYPLLVALRCGWRQKLSIGDGDVLLGLGVSLIVVFIHSYFEWILVISISQIFLALTIGMIAALATQSAYWQHHIAKQDSGKST